jgi:putative tryptophan/tyrosine transport system substrate-binding protein
VIYLTLPGMILDTGKPMRRREFICLFGSSIAVSWPLGARAQQPTRSMPRVGWMVTGSPTSYRLSLAAFRNGLKDASRIEGQNITIEYRWAEGNLGRLPELAGDLVQQNVDVILAGGTVGAEAATHATSSIPIVAAGVGDLVELGLVSNLRRPDGNLTGFVSTAPETAAKRFQIIKEIKPELKRAAVLLNSGSSIAQLEWKNAREFAAANNIEVVLYDAHDVDALIKTLASISPPIPDALVVLNDPFMFTYRKIIADTARKLQLPSVYGYREFVDDGGMVSYGPSITATYRGAASYVDKILKGTKIADLPIVLPTKFELVINLTTAKAVGLTIPASLQSLADELIE